MTDSLTPSGDPVHRDACSEHGSELDSQRLHEVADAKDHHRVRPLIPASHAQRPPFAMRIAVEDHAAHLADSGATFSARSSTRPAATQAGPSGSRAGSIPGSSAEGRKGLDGRGVRNPARRTGGIGDLEGMAQADAEAFARAGGNGRRWDGRSYSPGHAEVRSGHHCLRKGCRQPPGSERRVNISRVQAGSRACPGRANRQCVMPAVIEGGRPIHTS